MAQLALKLADNVDGEFFVASTCIDCDACRQIAPAVFHDVGDQSAVHHQPATDEELLAAQKALISCPTASIGTASRQDMSRALADLPEHVGEDLYRCGYTSESSFGAFSYLIRKESGNVLIDSPRFAGPLVKNIDRMGGVARMLLTHQDDVADHEKFASRFAAQRVLHRDDVRAKTASVELQPSGSDPVKIEPGRRRGGGRVS